MTQSLGELKEIPMKVIFADENFNCRGKISPIDVVGLAKDIGEHGLQNPILLMPYEKDGYLYKVVAGHRRHFAHRVLKKETIPAIVRTDLDDIRARILNLTENLQRQELNLMQEARAIRHLKVAGLTQDDVAREIGQSRGWVQVRFMALEFPADIQEALAAGLLNQIQIRDVYSLPRKEWHEAVKKIIEAKGRGERVKVKKPAKLRDPLKTFKRSRDRETIFPMMDTIMGTIKPCFATRCMAWCAGEISDLEIFRDLKQEAEKQGKTFTIPRVVLAALAMTG